MLVRNLIYNTILLVLTATGAYGATDVMDPLGVEESSLQENVGEIKEILKESVERVFQESDFYKKKLEELQRRQVATADKDRDQDVRIETAAIERKFMMVKVGLLQKKGDDDRKAITLLAKGVNQSLGHVAEERGRATKKEQNRENWKWAIIACGLSVLSGCGVYLVTRKLNKV